MAFVRRLIRTCWRCPGSTSTGGRSPGIDMPRVTPRLLAKCWSSGRRASVTDPGSMATRSGSRCRKGSRAARIIREIRSIWAMITSRSSPQRRVLRQRVEHQLGPAGDDVQRRPHLVRDARAELARDGERLRLPEPTHQLERPVRLGLHPLARFLQPLGHAVERRRDVPQLVGAPDRDHRSGLPGRRRARCPPSGRRPAETRVAGGRTRPRARGVRAGGRRCSAIL